jgi:hypothetical protein
VAHTLKEMWGWFNESIPPGMAEHAKAIDFIETVFYMGASAYNTILSEMAAEHARGQKTNPRALFDEIREYRERISRESPH